MFHHKPIAQVEEVYVEFRKIYDYLRSAIVKQNGFLDGISGKDQYR